MDFEYILATDLERAWLNFELDLPLAPKPDGKPNPFYVDRPENPVAALEVALLAPFYQPPKYFFSGHRGCGKSTELLRLAVNPEIQKKYFPIHFTIKDVADVNNMDYRDILLAIGGQMYVQYRESGGRLPKNLLKELDAFRGRVEKEITIVSSRIAETELEAKLDAFFAQTGLKIKLEPKVRSIVRQVIEQSVTELIDLINIITTAIYNKTKRWPLVLIDDLDKPDIEHSRDIFYNHRETMLQPACPIVYTVSSPLFYSPEFEAIRDRAIFLPNVKLHPKAKSTEKDKVGYQIMRMFTLKRIDPDLATDEAIEAATTVSGGVFREMARVMRSSVGRARLAKRAKIEIEDVEWAEAEIRSEYRRILTGEDRVLLRSVFERNELENPDRLGKLLQMLAVLEYRNAENWCDVHPALVKLLEEENEHGANS